jgi:hypothetical protein
MATPSLVAHTIINKYQDHLPLYRQEKIWQRMGVEMSRNTICGWIMNAAEACMPMRDILINTIRASGYIQADETPVQVMDEPNRKNTSLSYMWLYRSAKPDQKVILFDYRETRQAIWPKEMLDDYKGYLQTDGSLEIDNNGAENQIRPFALGRKNWLFSGSPRGAHASALFYSLIATAVANDWNPFDYLRYLFENIRACKTQDDYANLLPFNIISKSS